MSIELCIRAFSKIIFLDFKPSILAAAALAVSINLKNLYFSDGTYSAILDKTIWNDEMKELTGYNENDL